MRIAICFSGQIRTGVKASKIIKRYIGDLYNQTDFFMHTWNISQAKQWHPDSLKSKEHGINNPPVESGYALSATMDSVYDQKFLKVKIENFHEWNTHFIKEYKSFSPLWYSWYESILLKQQIEREQNFVYDVVIKMRPDIIFPESRALEQEINHFIEYGNNFYAMGYSPIRIDDVFFLSNSNTMDLASRMLLDTPKREWEVNLFGEYLESVGITCMNTKDTLYAILREEVFNYDVSTNFNLCFNLDRDYYAPYDTTRIPI